MNKNLLNLLITRYGKALVIMVIIVIGSHSLTTIMGISSWKHAHTIAFGPEENRLNTNFAPDENGDYYLSFVTGLDNHETKDYTKFRDRELTFFVNEQGNHSLSDYYSYANSNYYLENSFTLILISIVVGFSLFFFDLKSHFNTLLFSSIFSKKEIYWHKHLLIGGILTLSLVIGKLITVTSIWLAIPQNYLNSSLTALINSSGFSIILLLTIYIVSSLIGLLLGEWLTGLLTIVGFWVSIPLFINGITDFSNLLYYSITGASYETLLFTNPMDRFVSDLSNTPVSIKEFGLLILISVVALLSGQYAFQKTSLETNGQYLLFYKLRQPILWFFVFYTTIVLNTNLVLSLTYDLEPINNWNILWPLVTSSGLAYFIGYIVIYRRFSFKKTASNK